MLINVSENQAPKIKKGFTRSYKQLTFKYPLQKKVIRGLQKKQLLSNAMFNLCEVNLSGDYLQKWAYTGKVLLTKDEFKQIKENTNIAKLLTEIQLQKSSQKCRKQFKVLNIPFIYLLSQSLWETARLNVIRKKDLNLLKLIQSVQLPKLQVLQLMGNNLTSIQPLQTLQLSTLRYLSLRVNQITSIKSIQKLNCKNLVFLDINVNFLNSEKAFEGLTKLNAQNLSQVQLNSQHNQKIIQKVNYFEMTHFDILGQQYQPWNKTYAVQNNINWQIQQNQAHFNMRYNLKYLFRNRPAIQMIDYLIQKTLNYSQFKFLLKSNSDSDQLFHPRSNKKLPSPYHYFVYYSTDIQKFIQNFEDYWIQQGYDRQQQFDEHSYQEYDFDKQYQKQINCPDQRDYSNLVIHKKGYFYT